MDSRPLRAKPPAGAVRNAGADAAQAAGDETPLAHDADDWSNLGATRVVHPPGAANSEAKADDTALPPPISAPTIAENALFGDFRLLKKVGEGAMGEVWKARQLSINREVALKILFPHVAGNPKLVKRLHLEGQVMGLLDHPNMVQAFEVNEIRGKHYVAMEYVDGESLQKWLLRVGRVSVGDALRILLSCARALEYAHNLEYANRKGIIHRDIKPDNVLITRQGQVKVADLGMVKTDDEEMSLTQTGHAVGTPWYMPLEQARNAKETDRRCDIYALGCMLYCLLTGQPPFTGRTLVEVIEAKEKGTFPPARKTNADVPERLDLIILKMTAKLPGHRYQSCAEVLKDLESLGLANAQLSFLSDSAGPASTARPVPSTMTGTEAPPKTPGSDEAKTDIWYLRFRTPQGQVQLRKLTRAQVLTLAGTPNFDPTAKASRDPKEGFRALATYKEFEHVVLGRLSKTAADQNTVRYRNLYKKIEEQEKKRERGLEGRDAKPPTTFSYWLPIFFRVAAFCAGVGLVALVLWYFATNLGGK
jgi:serine/threonine protein kinase